MEDKTIQINMFNINKEEEQKKNGLRLRVQKRTNINKQSLNLDITTNDMDDDTATCYERSKIYKDQPKS